MKFTRKAVRFVLIAACVAVAAAGCATTKGSYSMATPPPEAQLAKYSEICIEVDCIQGVPLAPADIERIKHLVVKNIPEECPNRFTAVNPAEPGANTLRADVHITRYDEGNAFARWMLAGLGQMHINADVRMTDYASGSPLYSAEVNKTFAWGGMYGAFTQIKDIEDGFARAVAASLAGK